MNTNAQRNNKSLGALTGFGFHLIKVPPEKQSTEYHVHHYEDECVYVLAGRGTVSIGDEHYAIEAGDFIGYRAGGHAHTVVNTGDEPLTCIVVGGRLAHDVTDYPRLNKRLFRNAGRPWELVDCQQINHPVAGKKT